MGSAEWHAEQWEKHRESFTKLFNVFERRITGYNKVDKSMTETEDQAEAPRKAIEGIET